MRPCQLEVSATGLLFLPPATCWFLASLILRPWRWRLIFNGLYGVVSQKTELFVTTAVRTSNPTCEVHAFSYVNTRLSYLTDFTQVIPWTITNTVTLPYLWIISNNGTYSTVDVTISINLDYTTCFDPNSSSSGVFSYTLFAYWIATWDSHIRIYIHMS
jgi:hypothetical protein